MSKKAISIWAEEDIRDQIEERAQEEGSKSEAAKRLLRRGLIEERARSWLLEYAMAATLWAIMAVVGALAGYLSETLALWSLWLAGVMLTGYAIRVGPRTLWREFRAVVR